MCPSNWLFFLESCRAGTEFRGGVVCEMCAPDFYKNKDGGGKCVPCGKGYTTGGQIGQTQCKSKETFM